MYEGDPVQNGKGNGKKVKKRELKQKRKVVK
jgi:hypothetical protein